MVIQNLVLGDQGMIKLMQKWLLFYYILDPFISSFDIQTWKSS